MIDNNELLKAFIKSQFASCEDEDTALSWLENAMCKQTDPDVFFPEKGCSSKNAKRICSSCDWQAKCLEYSLKNEEVFGVWGGTNEIERREIRKNHKIS